MTTKQLAKVLDSTQRLIATQCSTSYGIRAEEKGAKMPSDGMIPDTNNRQDWVTVYSFDHIKTAVILCKAKIWQTFITVGCAASSTHAYLAGSSDLELLLKTTAVCTFACVMLYVFGNVFNKLIGFAYISHDQKWLKLSHLTFWGRRMNITMPVEDLLPLPSDSSAKIYRVMYQESDLKTRLILPVIYCTVQDPDLFELCFKINLNDV